MTSRVDSDSALPPELLDHMEWIERLVDPVSPPATLRSSVLGAVESRPTFAGYARRLARIFDVTEAKVSEALAAMSDRSKWIVTQGNSKAFVIEGGPRMKGAQVGFVELGAGTRFPRHRHQGLEVQFVMTGRLIEAEGREYLPGDLLVKEPGTEHEFSIGSECACICALVIYEGIEFV